jgi:hypothetical protein
MAQTDVVSASVKKKKGPILLKLDTAVNSTFSPNNARANSIPNPPAPNPNIYLMPKAGDSMMRYSAECRKMYQKFFKRRKYRHTQYMEVSLRRLNAAKYILSLPLPKDTNDVYNIIAYHATLHKLTGSVAYAMGDDSFLDIESFLIPLYSHTTKNKDQGIVTKPTTGDVIVISKIVYKNKNGAKHHSKVRYVILMTR